jgi:cell division protein FtsQ
MDRGGRKLQPMKLPFEGGEGARGFVSRIRFFFRRKQRSLATVGVKRRGLAGTLTWRGRIWNAAHMRGVGLLSAAVFFASVGSYGATLGQHWPAVQNFAFEVPDALARASGFRIDSVSVDGRRALTDQEILEALDFGAGRSLLFLNASDARERLLANPLVKEATIRKLYPNTLHVVIEEREPFALWQREGKLVVIAADGTVIDEARDGRFSSLPLVVGEGADQAAPEFLTALAKYSELQNKIYAAVRVGNRRWNLRLTNGLDVKLPAKGFEQALALLVTLDTSGKLTERDVTSIDLRLPWRATVRLSDAAVEAEEQAAKPVKKRGAT